MENKEQVLSFIKNFVSRAKDPEVVKDLFLEGYCYYFASMLKEAFNRGTICWVKDRGHIVWQDMDGTAYDILGEFTDYDELLPASTLYAGILDFKHNGVTTPDFERTMKVHKYHKDNNIPLEYDKINAIAKKNAAEVFARYDVMSDDPFQVVYYVYLMEGKITE